MKARPAADRSRTSSISDWRTSSVEALATAARARSPITAIVRRPERPRPTGLLVCGVTFDPDAEADRDGGAVGPSPSAAASSGFGGGSESSATYSVIVLIAPSSWLAAPSMPSASWRSVVPVASPTTPACRSRKARTTPSWRSLPIRCRSAVTAWADWAARSSNSSIALAAWAAKVETSETSAGANGGASASRATTTTPRAEPIGASGAAINGPVPVAFANACPAAGISSAFLATMFVPRMRASSVSVSRTGITWPTTRGPRLSPSIARKVITPGLPATVTTTPLAAPARARASRAIRPRSCSRSSPSRIACVTAPIAWTSRSTLRTGLADGDAMLPL